MFKQISEFICPICQSVLNMDEKIWLCDGSLNHNNTQHSFDVARQGYINLLPVQQKKSKHPGDSKDSVLARQRFLSHGFYKPLQSNIKDLIQRYFIKSGSWLDIGCGEGYYTQAISTNELIKKLIAIDISKPAVLELSRSSKLEKQLWYQQGKIIPIVTSAAKLPIANYSVHGVTSIFSPILIDEIYRVLVHQGILIIAKPQKDHLSSMRSSLFDVVRDHDSDKFLDQLKKQGFILLNMDIVTADLSLDSTQLADLLTMTPYSYRAKKEKRESLLQNANSENFMTEAKFVIYVLQKN